MDVLHILVKQIFTKASNGCRPAAQTAVQRADLSCAAACQLDSCAAETTEAAFNVDSAATAAAAVAAAAVAAAGVVGAVHDVGM